MKRKAYSRRQALRYGMLAGGAIALARPRTGTAGGTTDDRPATLSSSGAGEGAGVEGATVVLDPSKFPSRFNERPEFAAMVEAGTLPPVVERIGRDPLVMRPVRDIGTYGGTIRRAFSGVGDRQNANRFCTGPDTLLYWDYAHETVIGNLARDFELSDDFTELELHLRRGMCWSDGAPFTADDIMFWRTDVNLNRDITSPASELRAEGSDVVVEKLDEYTVMFRSPAAHPLLPAMLTGGQSSVSGQASFGGTGGGAFAPKHYLSQFLPVYTSEGDANQRAGDAGFEGWSVYFNNRNSWELNPELPTLTPWVVRRPINDPPWELSANPYSIWVDTDGNQLPYIGEISMSLAESPEVLTLRVTSGELDYQDRGLHVESLPVLIENGERGGYRVLRHPSDRLDFGIRINLAYDVDPVIGQLLRTTDFRRALSLGVDRDAINEVFFLGTSVPTATMCADSSPYFPGDEWRTKWATHDPDQANSMLDALGLTERNGDGLRIRPDGSDPIRLDYQAGTGSFADFPAIGELVVEQWAEIGIAMTVQQVEGNLIVERTIANQLVLSGHNFIGTDDPFLRPDIFLPTNTNNYPGMIGIPYALWFASDGAEGVEPPPELELLKEAMALRLEGLQAPEDERIEIGKELFMMHADQVWSIGAVGFGLADGIHIANNTLQNVPERILNSQDLRTANNTYPLTFHYGE